jgi:periplasmic protein TonB
MGVYTNVEGNWLTRRGGVLLLVVALHILFYIALKSGFAVKIIDSLTPPIVAEIIQEVKKDETPPPPPPPPMEMPPVEVPPPVVDIQISLDAPTSALSNVTDRPAPPPPPPAPPAPRAVVRVGAALPARMPDTGDYYPAASARLEEQGSTVVNACIGANGRATTVTVRESSNFPRLDEAAVRYAKSVRYKAGTADGQPEEGACLAYKVTFKLQ